MSDMAEAFAELADTDMWVSVVVILGAFLAPTVVQNIAGSHVPSQVNEYPEVYGLAVIIGGQFAPMYQTEISLGGGLYTADKAAERVGIKSTVQGVGA